MLYASEVIGLINLVEEIGLNKRKNKNLTQRQLENSIIRNREYTETEANELLEKRFILQLNLVDLATMEFCTFCGSDKLYTTEFEENVLVDCGSCNSGFTIQNKER